MVGNAALHAAQNMKPCWSPRPRSGSRPSPKTSNGWAKLPRSSAGRGLDFAARRARSARRRGTLTVKGTWSTPPETQGGKKYRGAAVGSAAGFSYAAQVVEVAVDEETGEVEVEKRLGRARLRHGHQSARPSKARSRASVWMGMGQAMSEETQYHEGLPLRPNLLDYRVPTIAESPPIDVHMVESNDPYGPFGAKEAGEGALHGFPPALANAIADAIGMRFDALPFTPDKIFAALDKRARSAEKAQSAWTPCTDST